MPPSDWPRVEDLLDRCIDALIVGADWRVVIPCDYPDRAELVRLMSVAEQLCEERPAAPLTGSTAV